MTIRTGLKVGLMGAGGTGKTTDATAIHEKTGLPMMKSASRTVYEQLGISEEDCLKYTDKEKWELQGKIFTLKQNNDDNAFEFIADRTLLDHWAYCLAYCGGFIQNNDFIRYENNVRKHMKSTYTHIFYYPWGYWEAKGDGVRQEHWSWQSAIDACLVGYCIRWGLPAITVPQTQGENARQEFVLKNILGEKK